MSTLWRVFIKDGREVLRDRRTLFVAIVLPVLLYPVLALVALQILQLTQPQRADLPVVLVSAPPEFVAALPQAPEGGDQPPPRDALVVRPDDPGTTWDVLAERTDDAGRAAALQELRQQGLAAAVLVRQRQGGWECRWLIDDAHRHAERVGVALRHAARALAEHLRTERLKAANLPADFAEPLSITAVSLAPPAEAARSRLAGVIPVLLVLLALSGAFHPALDLIAGERERGTLETLLSWPGRRRDIFLGKLLVVMACAAGTVALNLLSLGVTGAIVMGQVQKLAPAEAVGVSLGLPHLLLCFATLLPVVVCLSALSLALAGLAASYKEAQTMLSPLLLLIMPLAMLVLLPDARPGMILDLVPVLGPLLALKEGLQAPEPPWLHLGLATLASTALAAVVVGWSARLLDDERFLYPRLLAVGWGRWRKWGPRPAGPGALEALGLFAVCTGAFFFTSGAVADAHPAVQVGGPLVLGILLPCLLHAWLGAYPLRSLWSLRPAQARTWLVAMLLIPIALGISVLLGVAQSPLLGPMPGGAELMRTMEQVEALGLPVLLVVAALLPGGIEELLCRGALLGGLRRALGPISALAVSAFLFAVLHGSPWRFAPQCAVGLVAGALVLRGGSLGPAVLLHVGHNALALLLANEWLESVLGNLPALPAGLIGLALLGSALAAIRWGLSRHVDASPSMPAAPASLAAPDSAGPPPEPG